MTDRYVLHSKLKTRVEVCSVQQCSRGVPNESDFLTRMMPYMQIGLKKKSFLSWMVYLMIQSWSLFFSSYLNSTLRCVSDWSDRDTSVPLRRKLSTLVKTWPPKTTSFFLTPEAIFGTFLMSVLERNVLQVSCISCTLYHSVFFFCLVRNRKGVFVKWDRFWFFQRRFNVRNGFSCHFLPPWLHFVIFVIFVTLNAFNMRWNATQ